MMGILIQVRDHAGNVVGVTGESEPGRLLKVPSPDDDRFPLLRGIDPYVTTTFSSIQMKWMIPELEKYLESVTDDREHSLICDILKLARLCSQEPHYVLVFIGD